MASKRVKRKPSARQVARAAADKEIRAATKRLKARGLIFPKKSLRNKKVTRYERERVEQLKAVLTGEAKVLRAKPKTVKAYAGVHGVRTTGKGFLVVNNEPGTVHTIRKGMISGAQPIGGGYTIERLTLPLRTDDGNAVEKFIHSADLDKLKSPDEWFAFRYAGYASLQTMPNKRAVLDYLRRYQEDNKQLQSIVLYRVNKPGEWEALQKREEAEREAELGPDHRKQAARERRQAHRQMRANRAALSAPAGPSAEERRAAYALREKARLAKVQAARKGNEAFREKAKAKQKAYRDRKKQQ